MKIQSIQSTIKKALSISTGLVGMVLLPQAMAEPQEVDNASFEFGEEGQIPTQEFYLVDNLDQLDGWNLYFNGSGFNALGETYHIGTLLTDFVDPVFDQSTWFNDPEAPDGDRVLILYTDYDWIEGGGNEYGVEQHIDAVVSPNTTISLKVDVGNIAEGSSTQLGGAFFELEGFPGYRVQLLAGDEVILEDFNSLAGDTLEALQIPEGEFRTVSLFYHVNENSPFIGESIGIRLVNMNSDSIDDGDMEVDFDNVRLSYGPSGGEPSGVAIQNTTLVDPNSQDDGDVQLDFDLVGKGRKQLLVTGLAASLHSGMSRKLAGDPLLQVEKDDRIVARNNNWENQQSARTIRQLMREHDISLKANESAMLLDLEAGSYSLKLTDASKKGGYAGICVHDIDPNSRLKLRLPDQETRQLKKLWNGKSR